MVALNVLRSPGRSGSKAMSLRAPGNAASLRRLTVWQMSRFWDED